ncbi:hypothetical protein D3C79_749250 [compost metagenome]
MRAEPGVRDLHLRFHRQAQGRGHRPPQRPGADPVDPGGLQPGRAARGAGLDLGVLRPVGVGVVRDPGLRWFAGDGAQRLGAAGAAGTPSGTADQYCAVGNQCPGARRTDSGRRAHHQPGRRTAEADAGGHPVPAAVDPSRLRPVRAVGRHHLLDLDPARGGRSRGDRPAAGEYCGVRTRRSAATAAPGPGGGAVPGRRRHHSRLPAAPGADRRTLRAQPVRH